MLLEKLLNESGVSGNEDKIRKIILDEITPFADSIKIDSMGNIIAFKSGKNHDKKVMLAAHMDEVGFIISDITDKGYLKFKTIGGIDTRVLISKRVKVGDIPGIIGIKAIHLQSASEMGSVPSVSDLVIDIGASSKDEAKKHVHIGDYATFDTKYSEFGDGFIKAKAIDDRVGCYILTEAIKKEPLYDLYVCFTVQEEVGLRGALVCAHAVMPDIALVVESTTCSDVHDVPEHQIVTKCGGGAAISFMDSATITDREYREFIYNMAKENNIPVQYKTTTMGGNDAGSIHKAGSGIKTASVSVPCRYLHSPVGVASKKDIDAVLKFVMVYLDNVGGML